MKFAFSTYVLAACLFVGVGAYAATPPLINYQAAISGPGGSPLDTTVNVIFSIYNVPSSGIPLWTETHASLVISEGRLSILLGTMTPISDQLFNDTGRYIGIKIGADNELSPRSKLLSVPYALRLETVDGASGGDVSGAIVISPDPAKAVGDALIVKNSNNDAVLTTTVSAGGAVVALFDPVDSKDGFALVPVEKVEITSDGIIMFDTTGTDTTINISSTGDIFATGQIIVGPGSTGSPTATVFGENSQAMGISATISGGLNNATSGAYATVGGGVSNNASIGRATVGGGEQNDATGIYSIVAGGLQNSASGEVATVAGGQDNEAGGFYTFIGGGYSNISDGFVSVVGGGQTNKARGNFSVVCGGGGTGPDSNTASVEWTAVVGGLRNTASGGGAFIGGGFFNRASGASSTISGGSENITSGFVATVPGGYLNAARGDYSFAAGSNAKARDISSIVFNADSSLGNADSLYSSGAEQIVLGARGNFYLTNSSGAASIPAGRFLNTSAGAYLTTGGTWTNLSDKNHKENFTSIDETELLERLSELDIKQWNYKAEGEQIKHVGPVSQDFYAKFKLGMDDKGISTVDASGVALAAIQALYKENQELKKRLEKLESLIEKK
ncbi:MAG: tail fiber domain-containing protein [Candidatus Zixiibacteriota bacterium]